MGKAISSLGVALLVKAYVVATSDATRDADKIYYELVAGSNPAVYKVADESTAVGNLFELCASTTASAINAWVQPVCLTDVPDLGGDTEKIETTTLCDGQRTYMNGIFDAGESLDFSANYVHNAFIAIKTYLEGKELPWKVVFGGLDGAQGSVAFDGQVSVKIGSFGVSEVIPMTVSIAIASELTFA